MFSEGKERVHWETNGLKFKENNHIVVKKVRPYFETKQNIVDFCFNKFPLSTVILRATIWEFLHSVRTSENQGNKTSVKYFKP